MLPSSLHHRSPAPLPQWVPQRGEASCHSGRCHAPVRAEPGLSVHTHATTQGRHETDTQLDEAKWLCTYVSWLLGVIAQRRGRAKHKMKRKNKQKPASEETKTRHVVRTAHAQQTKPDNSEQNQAVLPTKSRSWEEAARGVPTTIKLLPFPPFRCAQPASFNATLVASLPSNTVQQTGQN